MLEKREALLHKKMAAELHKAKEFNRLKNKRAALQCLKKKKLYEQQVENLQNHQLKLEEQVITLEGSKTTAETFSALRSGAGAMKQLHRETNIDEVDRVMDDINEQSEKMRQVQEALGQPVGYSADLDEDELDAELAELEAEDLELELGLEEELSAAAKPVAVAARPAAVGIPASAMPSAPSTAARAPVLPSVPGKSEEDAELEALQAEMELLGA
jgi:charged multivesicular body protein 4